MDAIKRAINIFNINKENIDVDDLKKLDADIFALMEEIFFEDGYFTNERLRELICKQLRIPEINAKEQFSGDFLRRFIETIYNPD